MRGSALFSFSTVLCIFLTSLQMCEDRESSTQLSIEEPSLKRDCLIIHSMNPPSFFFFFVCLFVVNYLFINLFLYIS